MIQVVNNCDYFDLRGQLDPGVLCVFTGPVDRYFRYKFGELGWPTLEFEIERLELMISRALQSSIIRTSTCRIAHT